MCFASTVCAGDADGAEMAQKYTDSRHSARSVLRSALSESAQRKVAACSIRGTLLSPVSGGFAPGLRRRTRRARQRRNSRRSRDSCSCVAAVQRMCKPRWTSGGDTREAPRGAQREQLKAEKERLLYAVQRRGSSLRSTARRAQRHPPRPPGGLQPAVASSTGATRSRMSPGAPHQTSPPTLEVSSSCARATP